MSSVMSAIFSTPSAYGLNEFMTLRLTFIPIPSRPDFQTPFPMFQYIGPLLSVNIFGITLGILAVVEANDAYPTLTNVSSVNKFRDAYFRPGWLETVESGGVSSLPWGTYCYHFLSDQQSIIYSFHFFQSFQKCCGYWGFWDHPGFIYRNKNFDPKTNNRTVDYIPKQCCKNTDRLDHCQSSMDIPLAQETSKTIRMTLTQLTSHFHCPFPEAEKRVLLEYYKDYSGVFNLNESISVFIHICVSYFNYHLGNLLSFR